MIKLDTEKMQWLLKSTESQKHHLEREHLPWQYQQNNLRESAQPEMSPKSFFILCRALFKKDKWHLRAPVHKWQQYITIWSVHGRINEATGQVSGENIEVVACRRKQRTHVWLMSGLWWTEKNVLISLINFIFTRLRNDWLAPQSYPGAGRGNYGMAVTGVKRPQCLLQKMT